MCLHEGHRGLEDDSEWIEWTRSTNNPSLCEFCIEFLNKKRRGKKIRMDSIRDEIRLYVHKNKRRPSATPGNKSKIENIGMGWGGIDRQLKQHHNTTLSALSLEMYPNLRRVKPYNTT
jgi:hypothetical protein